MEDIKVLEELKWCKIGENNVKSFSLGQERANLYLYIYIYI